MVASPVESTFTSPYYPWGYQQNASCGWLIEAPPGKLVELSFTDVSVSCFGDVVKVYDGESDKDEDLFQRLCGIRTNFANDVLLSYGRKLYVTFKTDAKLEPSLAGFSAVYSAVYGGIDYVKTELLLLSYF